MAVNQQRQQLARALADFWRGGAGPSHADIERLLDACDLPFEEFRGTKYDRVHAAVTRVSEAQLPGLVTSLVSLLQDGRVFDPTNAFAADPSVVALAAKRLLPFGLHLSADGSLSGTGLATSSVMLITETLPDLHDHLRRIESAMASDDTALLLGSTKELIESVCKFVLLELGAKTPSDFSALLSEALAAVGLHPKGVSADEDLVEPTRRVLSGLVQIGNGINDLRNGFGTGHGKVGAKKLSARHARLAAGAACLLSRVLLETYEDPRAPWRTRRAGK